MKHFNHNKSLISVIDDGITEHISSQCAASTKELRNEREREGVREMKRKPEGERK